MSDQITAWSQDANDGSFTFAFQFDGGQIKLGKSVNVLKGEADTFDDALVIAKQRAANAKKDWLDTMGDKMKIVGDVQLPEPIAEDQIKTALNKMAEAQPAA